MVFITKYLIFTYIPTIKTKKKKALHHKTKILYKKKTPGSPRVKFTFFFQSCFAIAYRSNRSDTLFLCHPIQNIYICIYISLDSVYNISQSF